jgi:hypothetical protein
MLDKRTQLVKYAVETNQSQDVRTLIIDGFPLDSNVLIFKNDMPAMNLFCFSVSNHAIDILLILIAMGANVNSPTLDGYTPIHLAINFMKHPIKDNIQPRNVDTAEAIIRILIYYGADVRVCDSHSETPLHIAASLGEPTLVQMLLNHGAEILAVCNNGLSAGQVCKHEMEKLIRDNNTKLGISWIINMGNTQLLRYRQVNEILESAHTQELKFQTACITELKRRQHVDIDEIGDIRDIFHKLRPKFLQPTPTNTTPMEIVHGLIQKGYLNPEPDIPRFFSLQLSTPL